jgi:hypothetical protein
MGTSSSKHRKNCNAYSALMGKQKVKRPREEINIGETILLRWFLEK